MPPGFPNDTYPLMVSSGERFHVTPVGRTESSGFDIKALGKVLSKLMIPQVNIDAQVSGDQDLYELAYAILDVQRQHRG